MIDDLIRRQDAVSRMSDLICELKSERLPTWDEVYNAMSDLPSIQPEQKPGRWIINSDGYYPYCSICKNEPQGRIMTDYCPNCGAKMKK